MRLYRLLLIAILVCSLIGSVTQAANSHSISLAWDLPLTTVSDGDCSIAGYPIPPDKPIISRVQWRVLGSTIWNTSDSTDRQKTFTIQDLPPETTYEIRVGAHYGTGIIFCWTNIIQATTPAIEPPQGCTNLQVTDVK